ncbi:hypothetical protein FSHL1_011307 [Fusarium sambucinum]
MSSPSRINNFDSESVSSIDSFDPPPTVETKTITRGEALRQAGNLFIEIGNLDLDREPLQAKITEVLTEPVLRVLPPEAKSLILEWSRHYDLQMLNQITKFMDEDLEKWEYTVEAPNRRKDMPWCGIGADILRFFVADLKPLRKGLPEEKRRTIVNNVRHGLSLFADFHDEKVNAVEREAQAAIAGFVLREEAVSD